MRKLLLAFALLVPDGLRAQPTFMQGTGLTGSYFNVFPMSAYESAQAFSAQQSFQLQRIQMRSLWYDDFDPLTPLDPHYGFGGFFQWSLYEASGGIPGALIQTGRAVPTSSQDRDAAMIGQTSISDVWTVDLPNLAITKGREYAFSVRNTDATGAYIDTGMLWVHSFGADTLVYTPAARKLGSQWSLSGALDHDYAAYGNRLSLDMYGTTTVPEPSTVVLALVAVPLGLLVGYRRRKA